MAISGTVPYLWFSHEAMHAAQFYTELFPDARITGVSHYLEGAPLPAGTVLVVEFELFGRPFAAMNGGPHATHSDAVSFEVRCDTQDELDHIWDALIAEGGAPSMCGWCRDRFGVSWQVVPNVLIDILAGSDAVRAQRCWDAMLTMQRLDIAALITATDGGDR
jgi:predicted 3-demethylubiquinone-9 3-methyltransferase (glyoxalase superfamily)